MRVAGSGIPGRSVDDVRQHDEWYSEYLILKESKKKAIQEWKEGKEVCFLTCACTTHASTHLLESSKSCTCFRLLRICYTQEWPYNI